MAQSKLSPSRLVKRGWGEETRADKQGLIELSAAPVTRDTWRHARPGEDVLDERDGAGGDDGADVLLPRGQEQGGRGEMSISIRCRYTEVVPLHCVSSSQTQQHRRGQGWGFSWNISRAGSWCQETQVKFTSDTHSGLRSFTVLASLLSPLQPVTRRNRSSVLQFRHRYYNIKYSYNVPAY